MLLTLKIKVRTPCFLYCFKLNFWASRMIQVAEKCSTPLGFICYPPAAGSPVSSAVHCSCLDSLHSSLRWTKVKEMEAECQRIYIMNQHSLIKLNLTKLPVNLLKYLQWVWPNINVATLWKVKKFWHPFRPWCYA